MPHLYGADRGFFSERNLTLCENGGVTIVCIPQCGGTKSPEREACERGAGSSKDSASGPASRDASPCCSAVAA